MPSADGWNDRPRGRFHDRLAAQAQRLLDDSDGDAADWCAVIALAGLACEAAAGNALVSSLDLDRHRSKPTLSPGRARKLREVLRSKKSVNLKSKTQRAFWEALTGDRLGRWPDWIRYVRCVDRRTSVLHEGVLPSKRLPSRADAEEAVEVMHSLHAHLLDVTQPAPSRTDGGRRS